LQISPLGIGTWALGGDWKYGWGPQRDEDSIAAIQQAIDLGVNWIDTAPVYGHGHAELIVGRAVGKMGVNRPLVFTKCGMVWDDSGKISKCLTASSVRKECEASLQRLNVDSIDLLQIHWPTGNSDDLLEAWGEMVELHREGKARYLGVCNMGVQDLSILNTVYPAASLQSSYSLVDSNVSETEFSYLQTHGMGFLAYSPLGSGILTGKFNSAEINLPKSDWRCENPRFGGANLTAKIEVAHRATAIGRASRVEASLIETALGYVLSEPRVSGTIVGVRSKKQAVESFGNFSAIEKMARVFETDTSFKNKTG